MISVYFDRNVFADICELRNGLTPQDVDVLKGAIEQKAISIYLSGAHLTETIAVIQQSEELLIEHLKTLGSLINRGSIIKDARIILIDDCLSYAWHIPTRSIIPQDPYLDFEQAVKNPAAFLSHAKQSKDAMDKVASTITDALIQNRELGLIASISAEGGLREVWKLTALNSVENIIGSLSEKNIRKCRRRGIREMLNIRSVLITTIYTAWFMYSGQFGIAGSPRKVRKNDVLDMIHSIEASATEIFVTQENPNNSGTIPFILNQFPIENFQLMNLSNFIDFLKTEMANS